MFRRGTTPIGKCSGCGFDCGVYFGNARERNFSQRGVRGWIDKILPFGGLGVDPFAADEMWDADVRNCCGAHRTYLYDRECLRKRRLIISSKVSLNFTKPTMIESRE